jgi:methylated-DNA-[protein]-cysteine S-methyltransferase
MPRFVFPTPLGRCAVVWAEGGLTGFELPGAKVKQDDATLATLPPDVADLVARVERHLVGEAQDFAGERYDYSRVPEFGQRVLRATLAVKSGRTATYGEIAAAIGEPPAASRAVGAALGANRWPLLIPCHRITGADGRMTGFSGPGGIETKTRLLALEGACLL